MALTTIDDRGLKTPIDLLDNEKIRFGTGNDLEIYHDASHSRIKDTGTGYLIINTDTGVLIKNGADDEGIAYFTPNGAVELMYDNSKKFETQTNGITVTGLISATGNLLLNAADDQKLYLGASNDLQLYHNGSHSFVDNATGDLNICGNTVGFAGPSGSEWKVKAVHNAEVSLYYDNSKKLETKSYGVNMPDNSQLYFGTGDDLLIKHDGSKSVIQNSTGQLNIAGADIRITNAAQTESQIIATENGAVELYYDNSKKLNTESWGVEITGTIRADDYTAQDNHIFKFGDSNDLQIYHDGTDSIIKAAGTATPIKIQGHSSNASTVHISARADKETIKCLNNSNAPYVELYYDNAKVFYTQSYGATVKRPSGGNTVFEVIGSEGQDAEINMFSDDGDDDADQWKIAATSNEFFLKTKATGSLVSPVKIIGDTGVVHIDKAGGFTGLSNTVHGLRSTDNNWTQYIVNSHSSEPYGLLISFNNSYPDNSTSRFLQCGDTQTSRFVVYSDGDVANHDGTYGQTSDIKLKENIVDANSQWDDIKAVRVRNFNFKIDGSSKKQIGVVAQELETVCPGLVKDNPDLDENNKDLGTTTKSVKSSILYMKAIKALQEAITRIETLETEVAALKAK